MTIFIPDARKIGDVGVPAVCPQCKKQYLIDGLSPDDKQTAIDLTRYHERAVEYNVYRTIASILDLFPGTQHPLLVEKLPPNRIGDTDDTLVDEEIRKHEGLSEYLRCRRFRYDKRLKYVRQHETETLPNVQTPKLRCTDCDGHYLILPDEYYWSIGM